MAEKGGRDAELDLGKEKGSHAGSCFEGATERTQRWIQFVRITDGRLCIISKMISWERSLVGSAA